MRKVASEGLPPRPPMTKDVQVRFVAVVLALLTLAAGVFGWINYQKERQFQIPYDGVWWVEHDGHLIAERVEPEGPGARSGIKAGDLLQGINDHDIASYLRTGPADVPRRHLVEGDL